MHDLITLWRRYDYHSPFQSNELLQAARVSHTQQDRRQQLQEALHLLKGVSQPLNLGVICPQLAQVHYYLGIVELVLNEASKVDPQQLAVHFYHSGEPQEDIQGMQAFIARYEIVYILNSTIILVISFQFWCRFVYQHWKGNLKKKKKSKHSSPVTKVSGLNLEWVPGPFWSWKKRVARLDLEDHISLRWQVP